MSIHEKCQHMSAVIRAGVRAAYFEGDRAKRLARDLGCSWDTAKRILASGQCGAFFRAKLLALLERRIAANEQHQRRLRRELKEIADVEEMETKGRAVDRLPVGPTLPEDL